MAVQQMLPNNLIIGCVFPSGFRRQVSEPAGTHLEEGKDFCAMSFMRCPMCAPDNSEVVHLILSSHANSLLSCTKTEILVRLRVISVFTTGISIPISLQRH